MNAASQRRSQIVTVKCTAPLTKSKREEEHWKRHNSEEEGEREIKRARIKSHTQEWSTEKSDLETFCSTVRI